MSEQTPVSASGALALPDAPNLEWLRKQAKQRLKELRQTDSGAKLADAQLDLARRYGFPSWRALKAHVDSLTIEGQLFDAARKGDSSTLRALLDAHPAKVFVRNQPYEHTLLHVAAHNGRLEAVELLLKRGIDPNTREKGDNTYAMHWAAAAGHLDVVRALADSGGDVVGDGDDHALQVIGWATGWEGCDDVTHRTLADFLISRGARHHIYSAIALNNAEEVRRIVADDPSQLERPQSHNENFRRPLHFAVHKKLRGMVVLLLELGADSLGTDASGFTAVAYATDPEIDVPVLEAIRRRVGPTLLTSLGLDDWESAARLIQRDPSAVEKDGVLHLMAKRGNAAAVKWLLAGGANPNRLWNHWDALVTPLHLATLSDHADVARELLDAGADSSIRDSMHDSDALGWANFFQRREIVELIERSGRARGLAK
ncbi:MAG TPA: ankyrin repeat domain-containing protein [Gemmatimonadaceae bacterium]